MNMQDQYADERAMLMDSLSYDPETGVFRWKRHRKTTMIGEAAGNTGGKGYTRITVNFKPYKAHRLAWLFVYGSWPTGDVDHINMVKSDNRICNLRDVNRSENMQNRKTANLNNRSCGLLGATWSASANKWVGAIWIDGKRIHLGCFDCAEDAHQAYVDAKRKIHPAGML